MDELEAREEIEDFEKYTSAEELSEESKDKLEREIYEQPAVENPDESFEMDSEIGSDLAQSQLEYSKRKLESLKVNKKRKAKTQKNAEKGNQITEIEDTDNILQETAFDTADDNDDKGSELQQAGQESIMNNLAEDQIGLKVEKSLEKLESLKIKNKKKKKRNTVKDLRIKSDDESDDYNDADNSLKEEVEYEKDEEDLDGEGNEKMAEEKDVLKESFATSNELDENLIDNENEIMIDEDFKEKRFPLDSEGLRSEETREIREKLNQLQFGKNKKNRNKKGKSNENKRNGKEADLVGQDSEVEQKPVEKRENEIENVSEDEKSWAQEDDKGSSGEDTRDIEEYGEGNDGEDQKSWAQEDDKGSLGKDTKEIEEYGEENVSEDEKNFAQEDDKGSLGEDTRGIEEYGEDNVSEDEKNLAQEDYEGSLGEDTRDIEEYGEANVSEDEKSLAHEDDKGSLGEDTRDIEDNVSKDEKSLAYEDDKCSFGEDTRDIEEYGEDNDNEEEDESNDSAERDSDIVKENVAETRKKLENLKINKRRKDKKKGKQNVESNNEEELKQDDWKKESEEDLASNIDCREDEGKDLKKKLNNKEENEEELIAHRQEESGKHDNNSENETHIKENFKEDDKKNERNMEGREDGFADYPDCRENEANERLSENELEQDDEATRSSIKEIDEKMGNELIECEISTGNEERKTEVQEGNKTTLGNEQQNYTDDMKQKSHKDRVCGDMDVSKNVKKESKDRNEDLLDQSENGLEEANSEPCSDDEIPHSMGPGNESGMEQCDPRNQTEAAESILDDMESTTQNDDGSVYLSMTSLDARAETAEEYESDYHSVASYKMGSMECLDIAGVRKVSLALDGGSSLVSRERRLRGSEADKSEEDYMTADEQTKDQSEAEEEEYATAEEASQRDEDDRSTVVGIEEDFQMEEEYATAEEKMESDVDERSKEIEKGNEEEMKTEMEGEDESHNANTGAAEHLGISDSSNTHLETVEEEEKKQPKRRQSFFSTAMAKKEAKITARLNDFATRQKIAEEGTKKAEARISYAKSRLPIMIVEERIPLNEAYDKKQARLQTQRERLEALNIFNQRANDYIQSWRASEGEIREKKFEVDTKKRKTSEKQKLLGACKKRRMFLESEIMRHDDKQLRAKRKIKALTDKKDMLLLRQTERRNIVKRCIEGAKRNCEASIRKAAQVVTISRKFQELKDREKFLEDKIFNMKKALEKMREKVRCKRFDLERGKIQKSVKQMKKERGW